LTSTDIGASQTNAAIGQSLPAQFPRGCGRPALSSFGACNPEAPIPEGNTLQFSGRLGTDPALPVGYEDQLFATAGRAPQRDGSDDQLPGSRRLRTWPASTRKASCMR